MSNGRRPSRRVLLTCPRTSARYFHLFSPPSACFDCSRRGGCCCYGTMRSCAYRGRAIDLFRVCLRERRRRQCDDGEGTCRYAIEHDCRLIIYTTGARCLCGWWALLNSGLTGEAEWNGKVVGEGMRLCFGFHKVGNRCCFF